MVSVPALAQEQRLVSRDEIIDAFKMHDGSLIRAEDFNLRFQVLIDMLFETNPVTLRARLEQLHELKNTNEYLIDAGQVVIGNPERSA